MVICYIMGVLLVVSLVEGRDGFGGHTRVVFGEFGRWKGWVLRAH